MRFVRFLLWLVAIGAAGIWFVGLAHGFKGFTCVKAGHACTTRDLRFQGHVVVWLAPLVFVVSLCLVRVSKHYRFRFQQYSKRPVAQRQPLTQQATQLALPQQATQLVPPTTSRLSDGPTVAPRVTDQPESEQVGPTPRHAARDQFITFYEPANARPRHAAPEPEPEW
jgi:hypothetical protein